MSYVVLSVDYLRDVREGILPSHNLFYLCIVFAGPCGCFTEETSVFEVYDSVSEVFVIGDVCPVLPDVSSPYMSSMDTFHSHFFVYVFNNSRRIFLQSSVVMMLFPLFLSTSFIFLENSVYSFYNLIFFCYFSTFVTSLVLEPPSLHVVTDWTVWSSRTDYVLSTFCAVHRS